MNLPPRTTIELPIHPDQTSDPASPPELDPRPIGDATPQTIAELPRHRPTNEIYTTLGRPAIGSETAQTTTTTGGPDEPGKHDDPYDTTPARKHHNTSSGREARTGETTGSRPQTHNKPPNPRYEQQ